MIKLKKQDQIHRESVHIIFQNAQLGLYPELKDIIDSVTLDEHSEFIAFQYLMDVVVNYEEKAIIQLEHKVYGEHHKTLHFNIKDRNELEIEAFEYLTKSMVFLAYFTLKRMSLVNNDKPYSHVDLFANISDDVKSSFGFEDYENEILEVFGHFLLNDFIFKY